MISSRNAIHHLHITKKTVTVSEYQIKGVTTSSRIFHQLLKAAVCNEISQSSSSRGGRCFNHPCSLINMRSIEVTTEYKGDTMRDRQKGRL